MANLKSYEVRYKVPWTDKEQYVYGFKFKTVEAVDVDAAREQTPFNAYDIHITQVPSLNLKSVTHAA